MRKFLIIDDHVVVRIGLKQVLSELYNSEAECFEAWDDESAGTLLKRQPYDLIILDIQLPGTDTLRLLEHIVVKYAGAKVLVFSVGSETVYAKRFLKAGALGYLSKEAPATEIKRALDAVLAGKRYLSDVMISLLLTDAAQNIPDNPFKRLSDRESEVALLLLRGQSAPEIAQRLHIQLSTVGTYKTRIFEKLQVTNILRLKELAELYHFR